MKDGPFSTAFRHLVLRRDRNMDKLEKDLINREIKAIKIYVRENIRNCE